ncbi:MAG: outer membrane beta-barrel protein [Rhizobiaceae bacterium]|nr:outer membrane beta-barrel protein [Rhizobiaceae bacterium]
MSLSLKKTPITVIAAFAVTAAVSASSPAFAEGTLSVYGGANFSPHSRVKTSGTAYGPTSNSVKWDGASFEMPPYYGVRATWWFEHMPEFGVALDFTHAKVKSDPLPTDFTTLEFTDGINFLTANALYRNDLGNGFTPYAGVGLGLAIPHVEVEGAAVDGTITEEYQVTGLAAQAFIGVDYQLDEDWSLFGEIKTNYGQVDADLNGGGKLDTNIISNQIIVGLTYKLF